mgnify:CR=1 FL=1
MSAATLLAACCSHSTVSTVPPVPVQHARGLDRTDLDGLLLNPGLTWRDMGMGSFQLQQAMGLHNLRLTATMNLGGATAGAMIQHAAQAIAAGMCSTVACVFSDAPLRPPSPAGKRHTCEIFFMLGDSKPAAISPRVHSSGSL